MCFYRIDLFANNMLKLDVDSQYADIMEKALYNTVIDGLWLLMENISFM